MVCRFMARSFECAGNFMSDVKKAQASRGVEPVWDQSQAAWDEARARGTSGGLRGISGADWLLYGAVAAVALGIGVVNALSKAQDVAWHGGSYDAGTPLLWEMTSIAVIIVLAPMLFVAVRRMRHATGWPRRLGLAVAGLRVVFALHITRMGGLPKRSLVLVRGFFRFCFSVATPLF